MHEGDYQLPIPIVTERLVIRQAVRTDMEEWSALYGNPKVRQYLNGPLNRSAQAWWNGQQPLLANVDQALSVVLSATNEFVGTCGFFKTEQLGEWEAWVQLRTSFWGKAIGTETTLALMRVAFKSLAAERVVGLVDPANVASINMIEKLGFVFIREYAGKSLWQSGHHVYGVERLKDDRAVDQTLPDKTP